MDVYGLIGYPLVHSFSKKYFEDKFSREKIDDVQFELFSLPSITEIRKILASNPKLRGLAVTIPHKISIIPFLNETTKDASLIGAVNCIKIVGGKLLGYNTDCIGFEKSLVPLLAPHHKGALILGNGGASKAVKFALQKLRIPYLIATRDNTRLEGYIQYEQIDGDVLSHYPVIINCTPIGMHPLEAEMPVIPYSLLTAENFLYDLIYNPEETAFLQEGKKRGCQLKNGFEMLCLQADENWKIWTSDLVD